MYYHLDVSIHARPREAVAAACLELEGVPYFVLRPEPAQQGGPMSVSFEEVVQRLERMPQMFVEPDGAFLWVSAPDSPPWQLEGCIYDRNEYVIYVDVSGSCPTAQFDQLLTAFDWPRASLMFGLLRHGVFLAEEELRRFACRGPLDGR